MPTQVSFRRREAADEGLRSRKKQQTCEAIEDAALMLFDAAGFDATTVDQIAAAANVSTTTFFRYFPTKADVVLGHHGQQLPALRTAIVGRPPHESDVAAVHHAVIHEWVAVIDPARTAARARVVASSAELQGLSYQRGHRWLDVLTEALAERHGSDPGDLRATVAARALLGVLASAVESWLADACRGELEPVVHAAFDAIEDLCAAWVSPAGADEEQS